MRASESLPFLVSCGAAIVSVCIAFAFVRTRWSSWRIGVLLLVGATSVGVCVWKWSAPPETFPYEKMRRAGEVSLVQTLIPYSPAQRSTERDDSLLPAFTRVEIELSDGNVFASPMHLLGTDEDGQDVLSQLIHACRVAMTVGLVATGVAFVIGVSLGACMGWFGGFIDAAIMRIVEVFLSLPVLFVLIVAAGLFPRSVLVMAVLIGLFSWQGVARLTRAEFMKLRELDYVQAARAQGVPLRSLLFRHMLPNGVAAAIVDASFTVSAAVLAEAVISYLGFGPADQASWGRLLSQAVSETGGLVPHLAFVPGLMIFGTVLSANALGSAANDAIDPTSEETR